MQKSELTVDRFQIPHVVFGDGPHLLVCVNGMQQTMASWRAVVRHFTARSVYRVALFDFPNQGRGRCLYGRDGVDVEEQVRVLGAVVDAISPGIPVALIGGSWGAVVAAAYAARRPHRVARMVLGSFQVRANGRLREVARIGRSLVKAGRSDELADLFIDAFGAQLSPARKRSIAAQFGALRAEQFQQMYEQAERLVNAEDLGRIADLHAIEAETLIVNGGADPIVDSVDPETLRRIRGAELCVIPNVGHFLHVERPVVLDTYAEFLHRNVQPAPPAFRTVAPSDVDSGIEAGHR
jgi:pimeloyl-ACP methyl ester carboxylesterase